MKSIQFLQRGFLWCLAILSVLLTGCASTLRSDVTSFQRWPANAASSTYSFKRTGQQVGSLEHSAYEDLVRQALKPLGLNEAGAGAKGRFEARATSARWAWPDLPAARPWPEC